MPFQQGDLLAYIHILFKVKHRTAIKQFFIPAIVRSLFGSLCKTLPPLISIFTLSPECSWFGFPLFSSKHCEHLLEPIIFGNKVGAIYQHSPESNALILSIKTLVGRLSTP